MLKSDAARREKKITHKTYTLLWKKEKEKKNTFFHSRKKNYTQNIYAAVKKREKKISSAAYMFCV